jgi:hypothetical protein
MFIRISPFYNLLSFLSQMAGDKRKGKAVAESKKKKTRQESGTVYFQCQTHRVSHRGVYGLERVHRVRGSSPRVSSSSRLSSSNSSYVAQAEVSSQQSRQSHLPHWPGPDLGLVEDTLSRSRHHAKGELQLRSSLSESSRLTTHRSPEVHEQRPSESTSVTSVTCQG